MFRLCRFACSVLLATLTLTSAPLHAAGPGSDIGVVVMHGKGGNPGRFVNDLASALEFEEFQVANLEMPWSGRRQYDVDINAAVAEITSALEAMRAKGAKKLFVAGHSQGGLNALLYAGRHPVAGVIAIAPGGQVNAGAFPRTLGKHVATARQMVTEGRGHEKAGFEDYEGARGTNPIHTTAAIYLNWFDPEGEHTTRAFENVKAGTPVLYVAPTRDYPGLIKSKHDNFGMLPSTPMTRMIEPDSDHLNAPAAAATPIIQWIREVAAR